MSSSFLKVMWQIIFFHTCTDRWIPVLSMKFIIHETKQSIQYYHMVTTFWKMFFSGRNFCIGGRLVNYIYNDINSNIFLPQTAIKTQNKCTYRLNG